MKIKVCGMKLPENITAVSTMRLDYMGFIFYAPSSRYVGNTLNTKFIANKNTTGIGVFVNEKIEEVQGLLKKHKLQHVQLHGEESPDYCQQMKEAGITVIKAFRVSEDFDFSILENYMSVCDYFLFDTKGKTHGGTGKKFNWRILQQYNYNKPFFLSGGIGPNDIEQVINFKHTQLHALDLNSKFEIEPGLKDTASLNHFIEKIKSS